MLEFSSSLCFSGWIRILLSLAFLEILEKGIFLFQSVLDRPLFFPFDLSFFLQIDNNSPSAPCFFFRKEHTSLAS